MSANGEEIIKDRSPDGRFALQLSRDSEGMFAFGVIDLASKKELASLDSIGNPYAKQSHLVWSPDSKRVAFNADNRRGGELTIYQLKNDEFVEMKLPELPSCGAKNIRKIYEASELAQRWLDANTLLVLTRGGWTSEDDKDGECEKVVTVKFDPNGKASIQNVKSVSARELADRAKAKELVESGETKSEDGNRTGAIADYTRAIKLDPRNSDAYNNRGGEKQDAGDLDGAMADYNHAIEADPNASLPYYNRGGIYFVKGDWSKAIPDLRRHDELNDEDEDAPPLIWIAQVRLGQKEAADHQLAKFLSDHPDGAETWGTKIDNFLLGKVSEQELLAASGSSEEKKKNEQQSQAWYYVAVKHLMNGDKTGAADAFQKSIAANGRGRNEYDFAKAELKNLDK